MKRIHVHLTLALTRDIARYPGTPRAQIFPSVYRTRRCIITHPCADFPCSISPQLERDRCQKVGVGIISPKAFRRRIVRYWHPLGCRAIGLGKPPQGEVINKVSRIRVCTNVGDRDRSADSEPRFSRVSGDRHRVLFFPILDSE